MINELWVGIENKCKDVNVAQCQVLLNTDSALNSKMSTFVNVHLQDNDF